MTNAERQRRYRTRLAATVASATFLTEAGRLEAELDRLRAALAAAADREKVLEHALAQAHKAIGRLARMPKEIAGLKAELKAVQKAAQRKANRVVTSHRAPWLNRRCSLTSNEGPLSSVADPAQA